MAKATPQLKGKKMQTIKTIKTENSFGKEVNLTKEQFVKRWTSWAFDYYNLVHWSEAKEFVDKVKKTAEENFDREVETKANMDALTIK